MFRFLNFSFGLRLYPIDNHYIYTPLASKPALGESMPDLMESLVATILDQLDEVVFVVDGDGEFIYANNHAAVRFGLTPQELTGRKIAELFPPDIAERQLQSVRKALVTESIVSIENSTIIHNDVRWFRTTLFPIHLDDDQSLVAAIARDTTASHLAEEAAQRSEERNRSLLAAIPDMMFVVDEAGTFLDYSAAPEHLSALPRDKVLGSTIGEIDILLGDPQAILDAIVATIRTKAMNLLEFRLATPRGTGIFEARIVPHGVREALIIVRDVTETRQAVQSLRESEELNRSLIDTAPIGILYINAQGVIVYENPALAKLMGVPEGTISAVIGMRYTDLNALRAIGGDKLIARVLDGEVLKGEEVEYISLYGVRRVLEVAGTPLILRQDFVEGALLLMKDVTELRDLENRFIQAQKMEAIGRLAGGVAHDFNNLLTGIIGHAELARLTLRPEDPAGHDLEEIQKIAERAGLLTQQLLAFGKRQVVQPRVLNLNEVITGMEEIAKRTIGEDVHLQFNLDSDLGNIYADRVQIGQVLLNLIVNARDAMPDGGKLTIETSNIVVDNEFVRSHPGLKPGRHAILAVSDTGIGMDEELITHIFEPFYTTKEEGKGTGLGLSTLHGIVSQNSGAVTVYSEVGKGTTFRVYLPSVSREVEGEEAAARPRSGLVGHEHILVVEDDDSVRISTTRNLKLFGYTVHAAATPEEALAFSRNEQAQIDMVLTDVILPNVKGPDLVRMIQEIRPNVHVLYISGYTPNAIVHHGHLRPDIDYLPKPFRAEDLVARIRDILDAGK